MAPNDLPWDDEHPTFQALPKPTTAWSALVDDAAMPPPSRHQPVEVPDEDLIATVQATRVDLKTELAQTKQRLRVASLVAAGALGTSLALAAMLWTARGPQPSEPSRIVAAAPVLEVEPPKAPPAINAAPAAVDDDVDAPEVEDADDPDPAEASADDAAPDFGLTARGEGITMYVDGAKKGALPLTVTDVVPGVHDVRFEDTSGRKRVVQVELGSDQHIDLGDIAFDPNRVQVVIALYTPSTSVTLQPEGGPQQQLTGPWPMSMELAPGKYTLVASRAGRPTYTRPLVLDLERPYREVQIQLQRRRRRR